ncbi:S-layer homology domain-containing protein [uncultured Flavonifractor sp.]|uniref:S-layer homology domain-containing protein n=1 Tax=uncultured Flavonifractor sp. TaxID=1193534 RepID=UPI00262C0813|nr:S-layer homology domain-containing protein [uncultured Flavonifractor sp.]
MKVRKWLSTLLAAALLVGMMVLPPASAAGNSAFTDITDPAQANAAEMLRLLGVVNGTGGGAFRPQGTLTRGEFCKMTVEIMGRGDEEPAQRSRTIFTDVGSTHWARGYINLAASITVGGSSGSGGEGAAAGTRLIMGVGDGSFQPDRVITCGEAVTILMRVLAYGDSDVAGGLNWYDGYMGLAHSAGLLDGLTLTGASTISRGQAAILFYNLLFAKTKGSDSLYLTGLGCRVEDGGILLDVNASLAGSNSAVKTSTGTYKTDRTGMDESMEGMQGDVVLDKNDKLLAFQPKENITSRAVNVAEWAYNEVRLTGGETLELDPQSDVYQDGEKKTYEQLWQDLKPGTPATFYYTAEGKVDYVFLRSASASDTAMVARSKPSGNPFTALAGGESNYQIYKNGMPATVNDIRQYDVATYDSGAKVMNISDLRLTGMYENVYPNTDTPATIWVMGVKLQVLPCATEDLRNFKIGDTLTVLLTSDGKVAGAVTTAAAKSNAVGYVESIDEEGKATVQLLNSVLGKVEGQTSYRKDSATKMMGELVTVSSYKLGQITLTRLTGGSSGSVTGKLDVVGRTLGGTALADNVAVYEKVGTSKLQPIKYSQITCTSVPASKILYAGKDYAGRYNVLVLDDVTGDLYTYGFMSKGSMETSSSMGPIVNSTVIVTTTGEGEGTKLELVGGVDVPRDAVGGIVASLNTLEGKNKVAGHVFLKELDGVRRSAFDMKAKTVTTTDMVLPISDNVVCYNKTTKQWFTDEDPMTNLNQARAFSDNMTLYYDRAPEDGGKVRMVVVQ